MWASGNERHGCQQSAPHKVWLFFFWFTKPIEGSYSNKPKKRKATLCPPPPTAAAAQKAKEAHLLAAFSVLASLGLQSQVAPLSGTVISLPELFLLSRFLVLTAVGLALASRIGQEWIACFAEAPWFCIPEMF